MAAAVIEFDTLPDAVGPATKNDHFLGLGRRRLVFFFISRVEVGRVTLKFSSAGIHALVHRPNAMLLAQMANLLRCTFTVRKPPYIGKSRIGDTGALGIA